MPFALNHFDQIIYINLNHRTDRRKSICQELEKLQTDPKKIHRIEAHYDPLNGHRGCAISHIRALEYAQKYKFEKVLILEDDCVFIKTAEQIDQHLSSFFVTVIDWDVFFLASKVCFFKRTKWEHIYQILFALCAIAYSVSFHYIATLLDCYKKAVENMKGDVFFTQSVPNALDRRWGALQAVDKWYMKKQALALQKKTISDISQKSVDNAYYFSLLEDKSKSFKIGSDKEDAIYGTITPETVNLLENLDLYL